MLHIKNIYRALAATACVVAIAAPAKAQELESAYFTDGFLYRYQMNPAFGNDKNFVSFPGLGNLNIGMDGTLHLKNIFYTINGKTTTFLNPAVNTADFINSIGNSSRLMTDNKIGILSAGFKAFGGYNTISINARVSAGMSAPHALFSLLKEGIANETYDISDVRAMARGYVELGLGHSRQITDRLRVGATLKVLVGGADVDARFDKAHLALGEDQWTALVNAQIQSSVKGLTYDHDINENTHHEYVSGADVESPGINGFGLAVDLGAVYSFNQDWTFSASLSDLGFIKWNNNMLASTNGDQIVNTDKYTFNVDDKAPNSFDNELDKVKDDLSALYELNDMGDQGGRTTALGATMRLAAEYKLPVYRKLTFGLLNTTRIQGKYTWTDFRLSANVAPVKCFSAGANFSAGSFGVGFGWVANLHVTGFNLFVGMDHTLGKLAKQGVPLSSNASVSLGLNFPF